MSRTVLDLWVGFFVVISAAALLFLSLKVGSFAGFNSAPSYVLQAPFDDIGGLKVRAPVKSAGVVVGRVSDIRFDPQTYRAVVHFSVDARYEFPRDTIATIMTSGLLGEQYLGLEPGADVEVLKGGDTVQMTQSAVVLEKLIGQFMFNRAAE
ncbi:outer membrane lipid asymmetry maintenance protein MlaD [Pseudothauera nasutitermitis]|uniref:Outer membrane lipid asymmetry maintenance protein MlaD n=1 Tax=Pseudothauera nasutitermitis TaxID=2565930 RepID=A0A4V3WBM3_9RHOO|nr:outer membrane lipid asymmetry maintenance protein MlaD [Pseudothauera nasutitermitis]THF63763.1 outer membrane lipid asymmetry maintenance protein MlaD [Pseudothauera nasutitermitis]